MPPRTLNRREKAAFTKLSNALDELLATQVPCVGDGNLDGVVDETILKIERLTAEELSEEARNAGIADLADVEWGLLEADGRFSFITKQGNRPPPPGHDLT